MEMLKNKILNVRIGTVWQLLAFGLSLTVSSNGIAMSLWNGIFGRFYIMYWLVVHHEMYWPLVKKLIALTGKV